MSAVLYRPAELDDGQFAGRDEVVDGADADAEGFRSVPNGSEVIVRLSRHRRAEGQCSGAG